MLEKLCRKTFKCDLLFTSKTLSRVKLWVMMLQNVRLCFDITMFQIWKDSVQWLLRYMYE